MKEYIKPAYRNKWLYWLQLNWYKLWGLTPIYYRGNKVVYVKRKELDKELKLYG